MIICDGLSALFKSNFRLAYDDSMRVEEAFQQVIEQTASKLVITSGTPRTICAKLKLGMR